MEGAHPRGFLVIGMQVAVLVCYIWLLLIRPSGEGWGRAWNLVAFWIYSAPTMLLIGILYFWRCRRRKWPARRLDSICIGAALLYPVISLLALKLKA